MKLESIVIDNEIEIKVRKSRRAKRLAVNVGFGGAELVLPTLATLEHGKKFIFERAQWIKDTLGEFSVNDIDKEVVPILGKEYYLNYNDTKVEKFINIKEDQIIVSCPQSQLNETLKIFLKRKLGKEIKILVDEFCDLHGFKYNKIGIKEVTSRWGSCSNRGTLSFNWRLVFAPYNVLKYLVAHEVAHLKEMNHSKNFWNLVEHIFPGYSIHKQWIIKNGQVLNKYLR